MNARQTIRAVLALWFAAVFVLGLAGTFVTPVGQPPLGFLALYAQGLLPGIFAWPAGLGDIAIGVSAPWIVMALVRDRAFAGSWRFVAWNALGVLDLAIAVGTGAASGSLLAGYGGGVDTSPMTQLPLVLVPAFFVPFFVLVHVVAFLQAGVLRAPRVQRSMLAP